MVLNEIEQLFQGFSVLKVKIGNGEDLPRFILAPNIHLSKDKISIKGVNNRQIDLYSIEYDKIKKIKIADGNVVKLVEFILQEDKYVVFYLLPNLLN